MANKDRTPKPPQRVQAPQRRDGKGKAKQPPKLGGGNGNPLAGVPIWGWGVGAVAVVAIVVGIVLGTAGSSSADVAATMRAAGCTYRDVLPKPAKKSPTNYHADVPSLATPTKGLWSTSPPSGGAHYGLWAVWGFYRTAVNPRQVVHTEEHGAVVIWWGPNVPSTTVDQLEDFYNQKPDGGFGTPYAGLGNKIALTSWTGNTSEYYRVVNGKRYYGIGHIAICSSFNQKAFATFRSAYVGKGPEGIPLSDDEPGMGPS